MRLITRIRPHLIPSLVVLGGLAVGAVFAILWLNVFGRQPIPLGVLVVIGAAVFAVDPVVAAVRRTRNRRRRPRRAHARPRPKARRSA